MKICGKILKKICLGIFGIYSVNVLFSLINIDTIALSSFLGISGILAILVIKLII